MTLYKPYLIYIAISLISFIGSFVIRKLIIKERIPANDKYIKRIVIPICIYFLVKLFFGWRLNWFTETTILLILFVCFDYFIIIKNKYSSNTQWIYYLIRYCSFGLPFVSFIVLFFMIVISLGYGALATCKFFPTDRSSGEQKVYKNLYIYRNECNGIAFKKKFLFFEKDVADISIDEIYNKGIQNNSGFTGYIHRTPKMIYITADKNIDSSYQYIKIVPLPENEVLIEKNFRSSHEAAPNGQKIIKL